MTSIALRNIAKRIPVVRGAMYSTPQYHVGSVLENRLGLQIFRVLSKRVSRALRSPKISEEALPMVRTLERDGILVIPDFLDPALFDKVRLEFESASATVPPAAYKDREDARLFRKQLRLADSPENFPVIRSTFQCNALLDEIASAVIRRPITRRPEVLLDTYQCMARDREDNDIENILHADLHVPTIKMFFYLTDTNATNGAFVYAKGSHKLSLARLRHEYDLSVREAKLDRGLKVDPQLVERRSSEVRNIISPASRLRMKVSETQACVAANTLVIANNMGFHRRGVFTSDRPRKALLINYRNAERSLL